MVSRITPVGPCLFSGGTWRRSYVHCARKFSAAGTPAADRGVTRPVRRPGKAAGRRENRSCGIFLGVLRTFWGFYFVRRCSDSRSGLELSRIIDWEPRTGLPGGEKGFLGKFIGVEGGDWAPFLFRAGENQGSLCLLRVRRGGCFWPPVLIGRPSFRHKCPPFNENYFGHPSFQIWPYMGLFLFRRIFRHSRALCRQI